MSDSEASNDGEWQSSFKVTPLDEELLGKLLSCEIDNEDAMLALVEGDGVPCFVLNKDHIDNPRFDFLFGLANVIRRLLQVEDDIIDRWIGLSLNEDNEAFSIISFVFDIIDNFYDQICLPKIVKFDTKSCSLYNYLCGSICSFVMTMNEDQFALIEELLIGSLFSPNFLKALLASDVLCFLCRSSPLFAQDMVFLLFSFIQEIYVEDVTLKSDLDSHEMTIEIMISLCNRIITFMKPQVIEQLKLLFPPLSKAHVWKKLNPKLLPEITVTNQSELSYDLLCIITQQLNCDLSVVPRIVCNYITADNEYSSLLHLRLLRNLRFKLDYKNFKKILFRTNLLQISDRHKQQFCLNLIVLLEALAYTSDTSFGYKSFVQILYSVLLKILPVCNMNFVSKLYFMTTLQNLSINSLFSNLLSYIAYEHQIREDLKDFLKLALGKYAISDQDTEDYIVSRLKNQYNLIASDLNDLSQLDETNVGEEAKHDSMNDREDSFADFSDLMKRNLVIDKLDQYSKQKRLKKAGHCPSQSVIQSEHQAFSQESPTKLVHMLVSAIQQAKKVNHVSEEDKSKLSSLSQQLSQIIGNMTLFVMK